MTRIASMIESHRPGPENRTGGSLWPSAAILVNRLDRRYHERR